MEPKILASHAVTCLLQNLRSVDTSKNEFVICADRICTLLAEESLAQARYFGPSEVNTPCGVYKGFKYHDNLHISIISIMRSGDILSKAVSRLMPAANVGKILIQRQEDTVEKLPKLYYTKLPELKQNSVAILCDPMLATGGSAICALDELKAQGFQRIIFANVISCPEGIKAVQEKHPEVEIITCAIDDHLNEKKFIVPGLGDFGDRYYGT